MVSLFPPSQIKGKMTPFIGKGRPLFLVNFQCGIAFHKGKSLNPQNVGSTPLSLVIFQCGIASHKREKKILSLKIWGLQICPSSIEFMSVTNINNEVKRKCEK